MTFTLIRPLRHGIQLSWEPCVPNSSLLSDASELKIANARETDRRSRMRNAVSYREWRIINARYIAVFKTAAMDITSAALWQRSATRSVWLLCGHVSSIFDIAAGRAAIVLRCMIERGRRSATARAADAADAGGGGAWRHRLVDISDALYGTSSPNASHRPAAATLADATWSISG